MPNLRHSLALLASLNAGDHSFSIPVEGFAKGLYMVNIRTSAGSVMKKLVVE